MKIGILGKGAFGTALRHVLVENGHNPTCIDVGEFFTEVQDILIIAVPTQQLRQALIEQAIAFGPTTLVVNSAKGIERDSGLLPSEIVAKVFKGGSYAALGGPSFAKEIQAGIQTVINVAANDPKDAQLVDQLFTNAWFAVECVGEVYELELAGAMKNIYAIATGFVIGSGGGENTKAHLQVVALREYTKLVHALQGDNDVVRPCVVGDLILTCASSASRNYQYGLALATKEPLPQVTAEGVHTAAAIGVLAEQAQVSLPLAQAVHHLIESKSHAKQDLYQALGFQMSKRA